MKNGTFRQLIALLLCFAMILPNFTGLVSAASTGDNSASTQSTQTQSIPAFNKTTLESLRYTGGGTITNWLECDCGDGLKTDDVNNKSHLQMVTGTNYPAFKAYCDGLAANTAYTAADSSMDANADISYSRFIAKDKTHSVYTYIINNLNEVRIIVDTHKDMVQTYEDGYPYVSTTGDTAQTMMTMYGLSMSPNGYDNTSTELEYRTGARNCGALIIIRMPDNSLFINDGGDIEQWSDEACANFMQFCRELTGQTKANGRGNERVVINTWFISHTHSDHYKGLPRFIEQYHDQIDIKTVMYNIDHERDGSTRDMSKELAMVGSFFPAVKYYRPHTGEQFEIEGVIFDVLYTQEDRFYPDANGMLDIGDIKLKTSDGCTHREYLYTDDLKTQSDYNDTSAVLRVTFPTQLTGGAEVDCILYADVNWADRTMLEMYGYDADAPEYDPYGPLATDIMMVPHHGHDPHPELVAISGADIFMFTQAKSAIYGPDGILDADDEGTYRKKLYNYFVEMQGSENYFDTTEERKTYWEGTETACILFGEDTTFQNMPSGLTKDTQDPTGYTVYLQDAPFFEYEGWTVLSTVVGTNDFAVSGVDTTTKSTGAYGVEVEPSKTNEKYPEYHSLLDGGVYAIVHDKTDLLMTYTAVTDDNPRPATSVEVGTRTEVQNGTKNVYYAVSGGQSNDGSLFFSHHLRDAVLWKFSTKKLDGTTNLTYSYHKTYRTPQFGGSTALYFFQSTIFKGTSSSAEVYWNTAAADFENAWVWLQPNYNDFRFKKGSATSSYNIRIEFFPNDGTTDTDGDGIVDICDTCVIYYSAVDSNNGYAHSDFRFLTVDPETGIWIQKKYETVDEAKADLDNLKLRLYKYRNVSANKTVGCKGPQDYTVLKGTDSETLINSIAYQLTVEDTYRNGIDIECSGNTAKVGYYWIDTSANLNAVGDYTASIKYRNDDGTTDTVIGTVNIHVVDQIDMGYGITSENSFGFAETKASLSGNVHSGYDADGNMIDRYVEQVVLTADGYSTVPIEGAAEAESVRVGMLTCNAGTKVYNQDGTLNEALTNACVAGAYINTNVPGGTRYENLTLTYDGVILTDGFTLTIEDIDSVDYPAYPEAGSVKVDKNGKAEGGNFKNSGIAKIELSATGIPMSKGVDLIIVMDLSSSMEFGVDNTVGQKDPNRRIDKMISSLKTTIQSLQGSDVRIAMSDFGDLDAYSFEKSVLDTNVYHEYYFNSNTDKNYDKAFELFNHLNYVIKPGDFRTAPYAVANSKFNTANPSYMGVITPEVYTGDGKPDASAFVKIDTLTTAAMSDIEAKLEANVLKSIGTNYDIGLEYAYQMGYAIQRQNIAEGEDRDIVCIFMSDGAAMQYNYFSGNTGAIEGVGIASGWGDWLQGNIDSFPTSVDYVTLLEKVKNGEDVTGTQVVLVDQIADVLLQRLKDGRLANPNYRRADKAYAEFIEYHSGLATTTDYFYTQMEDLGYEMDWEFLYAIADANKGSGTVKDLLGADTEAEYVALEKESKRHQTLIDLLTQKTGEAQCTVESHGECMKWTTALQYPYYVGYHYFAKSDTDGVFKYTDDGGGSNKFETAATNFFDAFKELTGVDCSWDLFWKIADANNADTNNVGGNNSGKTIKQAREELNTLLHSLSEGTYGTLSPYSYFYNAEGKNWWAEAIKGDTTKLYPVINKYAKDGAMSPYAYNGDVENYFSGSTTANLALNGKDYISGFKGLGMELYTISFSIASERQISSDIAETVLRNIATGPSYFYSANSEDSLTNALKSITATMTQGATQAYFVDTMGRDFDLFTGTTYPNQTDVSAQIRVLEYTLDADHKRTGTPIVLETVTFGFDGLKAQSDQMFTTSTVNGQVVKTNTEIWDTTTGIIKGKYFQYNTKSEPQKIDLTGDNEGDYTLNGESFFWIIGKIGETEMVLEYQVYLDGTFNDLNNVKDARRGNGVYDTNTEAILKYINYRGENCSLSTVSPSFPWGQGRVGVAFYLVNSNGDPVANQTTFATTTDFAKAVKLTRPVYQDLMYNTTDTVEYTTLNAKDILPPGYTLYNTSASYQVYIHSNGSGAWEIKDTGKNQVTTYVESNKGNFKVDQSYVTGDYVTADTVVWFAVTVTQALTVPDTVVVDFGLPVDIHVMANDILFENNGTLAGVGDVANMPAKSQNQNYNYSPTLDTSKFGTSYTDCKFGTATVVDNVVRYEMTKMGMNTIEEFAYAVNFAGANAPGTVGYYYDTVTVIPATTIYYEDSFLTYNTFEYNGEGANTDRNNWTDVKAVKDGNGNSLWDPKAAYNWLTEGSTIEGAYQNEDRPGSFNHTDIDKDNIYGYDPIYKTSSTYSLGSAKKVTVGKSNGPRGLETTAEAEFTFWGTGFDVISMTSSDTGVIVVEVTGKSDGAEEYKRYNVDTYYGYKYDNGKWVVDANNSDSLYQVPVIKAEGLKYGQYHVKISVVYSKYFDHKTEDQTYDFYLDAIRIYDPANDGKDKDSAIKEAYEADNEYAPKYEELRNLLIDAQSFDESKPNENEIEVGFEGAVFIDGLPSSGDNNGGTHYALATYMNYGPNNEVYLAPNQSIAFYLDGDEAIEQFHIAMKKAGEDNGKNGNAIVKVYAAENNTVDTTNAITISTATDLYYDFTSLKGKTIVIHNAGTPGVDGILSITNLKLVAASYAAVSEVVRTTRSIALNAVNSLVIDKAEDSFILAGANTVLGGALDMNFFIDPADLTGTDYYAEITLYAEDGTHTTTVPYADWEVRSDYLVVTQKGLAARQMADKIEVVIYNGDGTAASDVWTDSIRDYAMRILEKQDDECKTLIVDMLNYGAAAQTHFGYNTDDLANNQLSETQKGYATETVSCTDQRVMGEGYYGSTLTLKDRIMLGVYFENITPDMYAVVSFTDHKGYAHETRVEGSAFSQYNSSVYGVIVDELVVADGDQLVTVTVYDADGNVFASSGDTVNSYLARQMGSDTIYEMVAKFTTSAYAYFH